MYNWVLRRSQSYQMICDFGLNIIVHRVLWYIWWKEMEDCRKSVSILNNYRHRSTRKYSPKEAFRCVDVRSLLDDFEQILMITISSIVYRIYMTRQGHEERAFILFHSENDLCSFLFVWAHHWNLWKRRLQVVLHRSGSFIAWYR